MKRFFVIFMCSVVFCMFTSQLCASQMDTPKVTAHHALDVVLSPLTNTLSVKDTITLQGNISGNIVFSLHKGMNPRAASSGVSLSHAGSDLPDDSLYEEYSVALPDGVDSFAVEYQGRIFHEIISYGKEHARAIKNTPGIISPEGVYLSGSSYWYPVMGDGLISFTLRVETPTGWSAVSQGNRTFGQKKEKGTVILWESPEPQDEIFLIAGLFTEYARQEEDIVALAFLRSSDPELAERYLNATIRYIRMYSGLIGPYAYSKFAVIENFWETGFGMPSFTLLGPKVIRFPFILHSSYPHEILHTWWGNCVFPDVNSGNWSEGLTAYLADHLIKEQRSNGTEHRQTALQKYTDYVRADRDFPLSEFNMRHSSSSEAIGYGKSLMFFHMLRRQVGDDTFRRVLKAFYMDNRFRVASFGDFRASLEKVSGRNFATEFAQWVKRTGAPVLRIVKALVTEKNGVFSLSLQIGQNQDGEPYRLHLPIAVTLQDQEYVFQETVIMEEKHAEFTWEFNSRPLRVDVDPEFDLFRRLDREETPPALSLGLGAKKMLVVLPSAEDPLMSPAYSKFADSLASSGPDKLIVVEDTQISDIPSDMAVTILGWGNLFARRALESFSDYGAKADTEMIHIGGGVFVRGMHTFVLAGRNPQNRDLSLSFIASGSPDALSGLGRKLPHYHKYSYLVFEGDEPSNVAKGKWPVFDSPLTVYLSEAKGHTSKPGMGELNKREPLASLPPVFSLKNMDETVRFLTSDNLDGRGFGSEGLMHASEFIARKFSEAGLTHAGDTDTTYFQSWNEPEHNVEMRNVVGIIPGNNPELSRESVVVGAHYDHLGHGWPDVRSGNDGMVHPGADDNASGIAVLLELARVLGESFLPERTVVFAAFSGEEAGKKGSLFYVRNEKRYPVDRCIAMLNIDTVGRLRENRLMVLGSESAREWVHIFRGAGFMAGVETAMVTEPLDASDHTSFLRAGVPAVQLFAGPHQDYHRPSDTFERIETEGLVKVAEVAKEVIEYLANRKEPLTPAAAPESTEGHTEDSERKVSLGIIPEFTFKGQGCRLSGVVEHSPAEECGLREGDIIKSVNGQPVSSLNDLSGVLRSLKPGDKMEIIFLRDGREMKVLAEAGSK